jgi:hypothetical protein
VKNQQDEFDWKKQVHRYTCATLQQQRRAIRTLYGCLMRDWRFWLVLAATAIVIGLFTLLSLYSLALITNNWLVTAIGMIVSEYCFARLLASLVLHVFRFHLTTVFRQSLDGAIDSV